MEFELLTNSTSYESEILPTMMLDQCYDSLGEKSEKRKYLKSPKLHAGGGSSRISLLRRKKRQSSYAEVGEDDGAFNPSQALLDNIEGGDHHKNRRFIRSLWRRSTSQREKNSEKPQDEAEPAGNYSSNSSKRRRHRGGMSSWLSCRKKAVLNTVFLKTSPSNPQDDSTQSNTPSRDCSDDNGDTIAGALAGLDSNTTSDRGKNIQIELGITWGGSPTASIDDQEALNGVKAAAVLSNIEEKEEQPTEHDTGDDLGLVPTDTTSTASVEGEEEDQASSSQPTNNVSTSSSRQRSKNKKSRRKKKKKVDDSQNIIGMVIIFDPTSHLLHHTDDVDEMFTPRTELRDLQKVETYCGSLLGDEGSHSEDESSISSAEPLRLFGFEHRGDNSVPDTSVRGRRVKSSSNSVTTDDDEEDENSRSFIDLWNEYWDRSSAPDRSSTSDQPDQWSLSGKDTLLKIEQQHAMPSLDFKESTLSPPAMVEKEEADEDIEIVFYQFTVLCYEVSDDS